MKDKELDQKVKEAIGKQLERAEDSHILEDQTMMIENAANLYKAREEALAAKKQRRLDYAKIGAEVGIAVVGAAITGVSVLYGYKLEYDDQKFPSSTTLKNMMSKGMSFFKK